MSPSFSPVRKATGPLLFVSGQVPVDDQGNPVAGGIREQTIAVFERLADVLGTEQSSLDAVVKLTYFITEMADLPVIREVIGEFFAEPRPASSLVEVSALVDPAFRIEVEAVATQRAQSD